MTRKNDEAESPWVRIVDHLADSVLEETLEELASDLEPGQTVSEAASSFRNKLLAAFDGANLEMNPGSAIAIDQGRMTLVLLIRQRSGRPLTEVARSIPNANMEFLTLVSRFPDLTPQQVRSKISEELESRFGIQSSESQRTLARRPQVTLAASSAVAPDPDPTDFEQILIKSGLSAKQRKFWLSLA